MTTNRYTDRLQSDDTLRREELIQKIEHAVSRLSLPQLEALSYDMFVKGYME